MTRSRRFVRAAVLVAAVAAIPTLNRNASAQDAATPSPAAPEVENSKYQFVGQVNANAVFIRSGASENDYPTLKLDRGQRVTVVGMKFEWLKILPPEGSFCYVAKAYVDRRGDGTVGRVNNTLNVRIGSALNEMKTKVPMKLEPGVDVQILGERDEYYKIVPPEGVYFYVSKRFVDPVEPVSRGGTTTPPTVFADNTPNPGNGTTTVPPTTDGNAAGGQAGQPGPMISQLPPAGTNATPPAGTDVAPQTTERTAPTTGPAAEARALEGRFQALEQQYKAAEQTPIEQQPIDQLLAGYQELTGTAGLPRSMQELAEFRIKSLKVRADAIAQSREVKRIQDEFAARQKAREAELVELRDRQKATEIKRYTAVGTLRQSSLQMGGQVLYRLTDPETGRTVIYIRTNEPAAGAMVGQFVGVTGDITDDTRANLKFISPKLLENVDRNDVNTKVAATIIPPSLTPATAGGDLNDNATGR
jgi:flagellin-like hook-associated protein FlgL